MRIYSRPGWDHARLELVLKSSLLKRLNLTFPLHSIDSLDLSRFFLFMNVDKQKLQKYMLWCNRKRINEADKKRPGFGNLIRQQINSYVDRVTLNERGDDESLMKISEMLKSKEFGVPNYSRFLDPLDEFNMEFCRQVSSQSFLTFRYKDQIGDKGSNPKFSRKN